MHPFLPLGHILFPSCFPVLFLGSSFLFSITVFPCCRLFFHRRCPGSFPASQLPLRAPSQAQISTTLSPHLLLLQVGIQRGQGETPGPFGVEASTGSQGVGVSQGENRGVGEWGVITSCAGKQGYCILWRGDWLPFWSTRLPCAQPLLLPFPCLPFVAWCTS